MDHVADVFVDVFRDCARMTGTREARLHLSGYIGSTVVCVYEPWPVDVPGLLVGDIIDEDWDRAEQVGNLFTDPLMEMLEPGGSRSFDLPAEVDRSIIYWDPTLPFREGLPDTPGRLCAGVVPPGFVSRLPDPWPGPAPAPPRQPRLPLKTMLTDMAEFAVAYSLFRIQRNRDN